MYIAIGGIEQWIQIEGDNPANPVLLFLHGGPGGTSIPAAMAWKPWQEHFTVVHWDQRGAAQTFLKNGEAGCAPITLDRIVEDGLEVADYLRTSLKQEKILLAGHSWGSAIGIHMIKKRPELFCAYVGTGQLVNFQKGEAFNYRRLVAQAERTANFDAAKALADLGPPPYVRRTSFLAFRQWMGKLAEPSGDGIHPRPTPPNPQITPAVRDAIMRGMEYSRPQLFPALKRIDLPSLGTRFDIPIFFFLGTADEVTPFELASQYFDTLDAPHKALVPFDGCHHFFVMNRPDDFLRELVNKVRPCL